MPESTKMPVSDSITVLKVEQNNVTEEMIHTLKLL
jgi:hypothetical protein